MTSSIQGYVICTTPRSGSTLLCKMLAASRVAGQPDSHFHRPSLDAWLKSYELTGVDFPSEAQALRRVFDSAIARGRGNGTVFALRLQRDSFDFFMSALNKVQPKGTSDTDRLRATFGDLRFIHLERLDKVAQAVSLSIAQQSGLWHRNADGTVLEGTAPADMQRFDASEIAALRNKAQDQNDAWADWFQTEGITPYHLTYEALAARPHQEVAQLMKALGLPVDALDGVETPTAQLSDHTNRAWITRFRANPPS
ncbi:MAG: Stf0 family sulfotransferase [Pseudomonadota bacterium]